MVKTYIKWGGQNYDPGYSRKDHHSLSLPERQTRVHARCKGQQENLRNAIDHFQQQGAGL